MYDSYHKFWLGYLTFNKKTTKKDFWQAILMHVIVIVALILLAVGFNSLGSQVLPDGLTALSLVFRYFLTFYLLASLLPFLSVLTRRINDTGLPWGLIFLYFLPVIGGIILLIFALLKSSEHAQMPEFTGALPAPKINEEGKISFVQMLKNYAVGYCFFRGRTSLASFWWMQLLFLGIGTVCGLLSVMANQLDFIIFGTHAIFTFTMYGVSILYFILILIPELSIMSRRLQDAGFSVKVILSFLGATLFLLFYKIALERVNSLSYGVRNFSLLYYLIFLASMVLFVLLIAALMKKSQQSKVQ
ncbi:MAG: DUF805 domain-containing protein [Lactococcus sp.]